MISVASRRDQALTGNRQGRAPLLACAQKVTLLSSLPWCREVMSKPSGFWWAQSGSETVTTVPSCPRRSVINLERRLHGQKYSTPLWLLAPHSSPGRHAAQGDAAVGCKHNHAFAIPGATTTDGGITKDLHWSPCQRLLADYPTAHTPAAIISSPIQPTCFRCPTSRKLASRPPSTVCLLDGYFVRIAPD
jgi:hypothetical protein